MSAVTAAAPAGIHRPFSPEENRRLIEQFTRDGYLVIPGVLTREEVDAARAAVERAFADPKLWETHHRYDEIVMTRLFELDPVFVKLLTREPMISLMEAMLGPDCHVVAQNAVLNPPGKAIDTFHVDDLLWFPLPDEIPRFDPRMKFPTFLVNAPYALTDVDRDEYGPLQVVPGSHYSGRQPNDPKNPSFDGRGAVSVHVKAGDAYLQHPQVWHRGAPNTSNRTRCISGVAWGRRFVAHRFYPFLNYQVPPHVLEGADERLLRVLGKHKKGAYG